jgi:hypothetical protein
MLSEETIVKFSGWGKFCDAAALFLHKRPLHSPLLGGGNEVARSHTVDAFDVGNTPCILCACADETATSASPMLPQSSLSGGSNLQSPRSI